VLLLRGGRCSCNGDGYAESKTCKSETRGYIVTTYLDVL